MIKNLVRNLLQRVKALEYKLGLIADYVVETGTSGIWTYEKWESGKAVARCRHSWTTTAWNAWGGLYEAMPMQSVNYPSDLFTSVLNCNIYPNGIGAITLSGVEVGGNSGGSTTSTPKFYALRGATSTNNTVGVGIEAVGTWK